MNIEKCTEHSDFASAIELTKDYMAWLELDLSFQNIDREFAHFSSMYGPPEGAFLLAWHQGELAGGVGLRRLADGLCEMKRLYVYDRCKNLGIGRRLCSALIEEAKRLDYATMRLDTLDRMQSAIGLYRSLGFEEIGPYRFNPEPTAKYMELDLT